MYQRSSKEAIKQYVTDQEKQTFLDGLTDLEIAMITGDVYWFGGSGGESALKFAKSKTNEQRAPYDWDLIAQEEYYLNIERIENLKPDERKPEEQSLLDRYNSIMTLRVIYFRQIADWQSEEAVKTETTILEFINDPTFVDFPELFTNANTPQDTLQAKAMREAIKLEYEENHATELIFMSNYEFEILGARIAKNGQVELLITHNQTKFGGYGQDAFNFSQKNYNIPPTATIGYLKQNPYPAIRGNSGQYYIVMEAPYLGQFGQSVAIEINLPYASIPATKKEKAEKEQV